MTSLPDVVGKSVTLPCHSDRRLDGSAEEGTEPGPAED